jgi:hypothetical protein
MSENERKQQYFEFLETLARLKKKKGKTIILYFGNPCGCNAREWEEIIIYFPVLETLANVRERLETNIVLSSENPC